MPFFQNAPLTRNMDKGFSVEQLAENIFVPEAFASWIEWVTVPCIYPPGEWTCGPNWYGIGCDPHDPDWEPCVY